MSSSQNPLFNKDGAKKSFSWGKKRKIGGECCQGFSLHFLAGRVKFDFFWRKERALQQQSLLFSDVVTYLRHST
jgi:hypothetical protein